MMQNEEYLRNPYGMSDFAVLRREGYYYVDKTRFIRTLEREGNYVFFLRPRRFGKSVMLNVIDAYYDVKYADQFEELFGGLDIAKSPTRERGSYLVLKFNFSGVNPKREAVQRSFNENVLGTLKDFVAKYSDILPAQEMTKQLQETTECDIALTNVLRQVKQAGRRIYLLIDEYDNFANTMLAEDEAGYKEITHGMGFFRLFFNIVKAATSDNDSAIRRIFITGVTPLTLSDVTSGFNIGSNFSMHPYFNDMVGFTVAEVRDMFSYYYESTGIFRHSVEELIEVMRPWYDRNCFSVGCAEDEHEFNSDMTLYFLKEYIANSGRFPQEMVDPNVTTDYNKLSAIIKWDNTYGHKARLIQRIMEDGCIYCPVAPEFPIDGLNKPENLVSLLFYLGMLTYSQDEEGDSILIIPNNCVREQYYRYMEHCYAEYAHWVTDDMLMTDYGLIMTKEGDAEPMLRYLASCLRTDSSTRDFDPQAEAFVKGFLLAKLGRRNYYFGTFTEREKNHGYSDIYLEPRNGGRHAYVIELKYCNHGAPDSEVQEKLDKARRQIRQYIADKRYEDLAAEHHWTLHPCIMVFRGWELAAFE